MYAEYIIKKESRNHLSNNNWGKAVAVTVFVFSMKFAVSLLMDLLSLFLQIDIYDNLDYFVSFISDFRFNQGALIEIFNGISVVNMIEYCVLTVLLVIILFFILCPISLGVSRFYYFVSKGESPSVAEIFYYFKNKKNYLRSLSYWINIVLRMLLWGIVCMLPGIITLFVSGTFTMSPTIDANLRLFALLLTILSNLFLIAGSVIYFIIVLRYFLTSYIVISREDMEIKECINISFSSMKGHRTSVLKLYITFIPWLIACFFVLPLLYVVPYFSTSKMSCAKWLMVEIEKKIANQQQSV